MSNKIELNAETRTDLGKGASRRLRHTGNTPAVVYGVGEPASITLAHKDLWKAQESEAFYSSVINVNIDGKANDVIVKDMQRHPAKSLVMHIDFQRVDDKTSIVVNVPLHFINVDTCPGVKLQGGIIQYVTTLIKVRCIATKLPEYIEVDLGEVSEGDIIHLSDLKLPEGVDSVDLAHGADHDLPVAQVITPRGIDEEASEAEGEGEGEAEEGESEEG